MNPNLQETLSVLAQKLGTTTERLFPILVAKERLDAWILISIGMIFTCCSIALTRFSFRKAKEDGDWYSGVALFGFLSFALSWFIWANISNAIYPEAAAIRTILEAVRG